MSKHGQDLNERRSYSEGFSDGRDYELRLVAEVSEREFIKGYFWGALVSTIVTFILHSLI